MAQSETTKNAALQVLAKLAKSNSKDTVDVTLQVNRLIWNKRSWQLKMWQASAETSISRFGNYSFSFFYVAFGWWLKGNEWFLPKHTLCHEIPIQISSTREHFDLVSRSRPDEARRSWLTANKIKPWAWDYGATVEVTHIGFWWTTWCYFLVSHPHWVLAKFRCHTHREWKLPLLHCSMMSKLACQGSLISQDDWSLRRQFSVKVAHLQN